jgi:hypothetical protein
MAAYSGWAIAADIVFGTVGVVAFMYGWKHRSWRPTVLGFALMAYPFFISNTVFVYIVGCGLTAALYFWRE